MFEITAVQSIGNFAVRQTRECNFCTETYHVLGKVENSFVSSLLMLPISVNWMPMCNLDIAFTN